MKQSMSKEDLYKKLQYVYSRDQDWSAVGLLDEFFSDKVIIVKGENRNPYVDIWHEAIENTDLVVESILTNIEWNFKDTIMVRIKQAEPIYEYMVCDDNGVIDWMTVEEFNNQFEFVFRAINTKRERKQ